MASACSLHDRFEVNDDYLGDGYGILSETEREAITLLAQKEGVLLDPVYTGRAMGGLIDLIFGRFYTRPACPLLAYRWLTGALRLRQPPARIIPTAPIPAVHTPQTTARSACSSALASVLPACLSAYSVGVGGTDVLVGVGGTGVLVGVGVTVKVPVGVAVGMGVLVGVLVGVTGVFVAVVSVSAPRRSQD